MPSNEDENTLRAKPSSRASALGAAAAGGDGGLEMVDLSLQKVTANAGAGFGSLSNSQMLQDDLEYGEYGKDHGGLAAASLVEDQQVHSAFRPPAVEFDPDSKTPHPFREDQNRFRVYASFAFVVVVVVSIGAVSGVSIAAKKKTRGIAYRETVGIREAVEQLAGKAVFEDSSSPYGRELAWVTHKDPKQMLPDDARFQQRFAAAVFYYSTSTKGPWGGGCAEAMTEEERSSDRCVYTYTVEDECADEREVRDYESFRWLSEKDECSWLGLCCDEFGQVREVNFRK